MSKPKDPGKFKETERNSLKVLINIKDSFDFSSVGIEHYTFRLIRNELYQTKFIRDLNEWSENYVAAKDIL